MSKINKSHERSECSWDRLSAVEQMLYEIYYIKKMLYEKRQNTDDDGVDDVYEVIVPRVLAALLRRTRLLLFLTGSIYGLLLGELIARIFF